MTTAGDRWLLSAWVSSSRATRVRGIRAGCLLNGDNLFHRPSLDSDTPALGRETGSFERAAPIAAFRVRLAVSVAEADLVEPTGRIPYSDPDQHFSFIGVVMLLCPTVSHGQQPIFLPFTNTR
ncbi:MAG: hypothetical protein PHQ28_04460 [Mycobacterium sp.]|nr:hypothetical protein [Mycobacterium sp.]